MEHGKQNGWGVINAAKKGDRKNKGGAGQGGGHTKKALQTLKGKLCHQQG